MIELPGKPIALGAAQPERDVDAAGFYLIGLLEDLAEWRCRVVDLHLYATFRLGLELLGPRLRHVDLEEARRSQKVAELERDLLSACGDDGKNHRRGNSQHYGKPLHLVAPRKNSIALQ